MVMEDTQTMNEGQNKHSESVFILFKVFQCLAVQITTLNHAQPKRTRYIYSLLGLS